MKRDAASRYFCGIEKDSFLAKVTKAYMAIIGDGRGSIFCDDALSPPALLPERVRETAKHGHFSYLLTNPPFGSKIKVEGEQVLSQFPLGHIWKREDGQWKQSNSVPPSKPPQVLFIDRCLDLLKPGGKLAIVLPESLFGNPSHSYITSYLGGKVKLLGLVSMPEDLFQPWTHAKACVLFAEKMIPPADYPIHMAVVKWCGHDSRGKPTGRDEIPVVAENFQKLMLGHQSPYNRLGFNVLKTQIRDNIYIPKYYDPEVDEALEALRQSHELYSIGDLKDEEIIDISTGHEVGKLAYGTGPIPFIRTSDLSNWELKIDPKQSVSEEIYQKYSKQQDVRAQDILMVRDGTYLIGNTAMITEYDTRMMYQSHLFKIRVLEPTVLDPYLLLAALNTPIVRRQIRSKQFTQDIIDTLGRRIREIVIPIPKDSEVKQRISDQTREIVETRSTLRRMARDVSLLVMGDTEAAEAQEEIAEVI